MNSPVCVDASFALKLVLAETHSDLVEAMWRGWIQQDVEIYAPAHLAFECTSVIRNHVYRKEITSEAGNEAFRSLHAQPISLIDPEVLNQRAWELAKQYQRPTAYDAYYLAAAELLNCELWTADRRLARAVIGSFPLLRLVGVDATAT
ncbi:MAG: type II toxin-antitoxin system VapC family toxin [Caldilinea sp.]|nr:type II toxin-antitoxin system VapC family toxin [Caldilinea sp.]MCB0134308.1 type II toxin-antitoxin system VapC family toxin [Caldilineaceae bacterium]MCB0042840.1 type II toxin-antitoxin system VapC family toxin [Caldilinea sp.]MCB0149774.1 type II toxin-antitoxin system VapC family toxin [Caldilineaceae bacterium]MCO5213135.1 type II toxin-antitoxin system VapC family toxin [Caldilinea sp.]